MDCDRNMGACYHACSDRCSCKYQALLAQIVDLISTDLLVTDKQPPSKKTKFHQEREKVIKSHLEFFENTIILFGSTTTKYSTMSAANYVEISDKTVTRPYIINTSIISEFETTKIVRLESIESSGSDGKTIESISNIQKCLEQHNFIIFTGEGFWDYKNPPSIPHYKRQIYLPLKNILAKSKTIVIRNIDPNDIHHHQAKFLIMLDIATRGLTLTYISILETEVDNDDNDNDNGENDEEDTQFELSSFETSINVLQSKSTSDCSNMKDIVEDLVLQTSWFSLSENCIKSLYHLSSAIRRDSTSTRSFTNAAARVRNTLDNNHSINSTSDRDRDKDNDNDIFTSTQSQSWGVKALPTSSVGFKVIEFFSGIGGMRLSLPETIGGISIKHIIAIDCSDIANKVYSKNFHSVVRGKREETVSEEEEKEEGRHNINPIDNFSGELWNISVDGLKLADVDGVADIWTMSPPCQPYTTTKGASRLDDKDNRSRGIFHLMNLLLEMKQKPRWIFLENVQGFADSSVLATLKRVLKLSGYSWKQYLLSPITCAGVPNNRMRYYLTAEYIGVDNIHNLEEEEENIEKVLRSIPGENFHASAADAPIPVKTIGCYTTLSKPLIPADDWSQLFIPVEILTKPWAARQLSIVGAHDTVSYCFTKSYGRIIERSSGSCFLEAADPGIHPTLLRNDLPALFGRLRLFHPTELLLLSGFPEFFSWPEDLGLKKCWACIGNSINVTVVKMLMKHFFSSTQYCN